MTATTSKPRRGLASIKTMFSTKRHSIAQIPISEDDSTTTATAQLPTPSESPAESPESSSHSLHKTSSSSSSIFAPNQKKAAEKAAEKEKKEQVKQAIQLSTVDHRGAFLPPTPLEKGYKDHFKDNDEDYFDTIISTPPERVRTFLSAASTISPGMFSLPSSKIKRHTFTSFPTAHQKQWSAPAAAAAVVVEEEEEEMTPPPAPLVPPKDAYYTPKRQQQQQQTQQIRNRARISFLTGDGSDNDLAEALADSISSLLSSSGPSSPSSQEVPDLMDDDDHSGSESSSANVSPRHSTASLDRQDPMMVGNNIKKWKKGHQEPLSLGGELTLLH